MTLLAPTALPFLDSGARTGAVALPATQITRISERVDPTWRGACWIGVLEGDVVEEMGGIPLDGAAHYGRARLLVRTHGVVRGIVEMDVANGRIDARRLRRMLLELEPPAERTAIVRWPTVTVVVCERSGSDRLARALDTVLDLDYPSFEVLVIGPAAHVASSSRLVGGRALWMDGMDAGIGHARNRGLLIADGELVAFTDDRVLVDQHWLRSFVHGFARGDDVAAVNGLTMTGELSSRADVLADAICGPEVCEPDVARGDGQFAAPADLDGARRNFAVRRDLVLAAGGWDATVAYRSPASAGEDTELFRRLLRSNLAVGYEPSAVAWSFA